MSELSMEKPRASTWRDVLSSPWLKVLLAAGVIYALVAFNRVNLRTFAVLAQTWHWLVIALLLMLPPYAIVSARFWLVLRNQRIRVAPRLAVRWTMIGSFFDIVMPSNSGGDVIKAGYIVRHVGPGARMRGVMAVGFDRVLGLLGLFLLAGATSVAGWKIVQTVPGSQQLMLFLVLVCIGSLLFFRVMGSRRLYQNARLQQWLARVPGGMRLHGIVSCFNSLRERPGDLLAVIGLSVLNHVFWCAALMCITVAFGQSLDVVHAFTVFPLAIFSNVFGFAGGFGVGTAAFDWIFARLLDIHVGAAIGLTFQVLSSLSRLIGLPFYLAPGHRGR
jgi:glycosyltransferase 2 family protein